MSDCNGSPCQDWIITLASDGSLTPWGWVAIGVLTLMVSAIALAAMWLFDRLT